MQFTAILAAASFASAAVYYVPPTVAPATTAPYVPPTVAPVTNTPAYTVPPTTTPAPVTTGKVSPATQTPQGYVAPTPNYVAPAPATTPAVATSKASPATQTTPAAYVVPVATANVKAATTGIYASGAEAQFVGAAVAVIALFMF